MRTTRIDLEGRTGYYATLKRRFPGNLIEIQILTPELEHETTIPADDREQQWTTAVNLQKQLDGCRGTNSMIHDYFNEICRLAD